MEHQKISKNLIKHASTGETIPIEKLWEDKACVVTFLRRFGCMYCRVGAQDLSKIKPLLDEQGVRLVAIGLEEKGLEEFVQGQFFTGELYVDTDKKCYKDLEFKRYNMMNIWGSVFDQKGREAIKKGKEAGVGGNLAGDGLQTGGTLIVNAGGERLLMFARQEHPADVVDATSVLQALGIQGDFKSEPRDLPACDATCEA